MRLRGFLPFSFLLLLNLGCSITAFTDEVAQSAQTPANGTYAYRLGIEVPGYWIPLVPQASKRTNPGSLRLRQGAMPRIDNVPLQKVIEPLGKLLEPNTNC